MRKVEPEFSQSFLGPNYEFTRARSSEHVFQFNSLENNRKSRGGSKVYNDDELVKHMSNVPCFLQQAGNEKSIQAKALNFGVLDWKRLETWKYNERMPVRIHKKSASSSNTGPICMASGPPKMSPNLRKQPSSHGLNPSPRFGSPQRKPPPSQSSHLNALKMERNDTCKEANYIGGVKLSGKQEKLSQEFCSARAQRSTIGRPQNFHQRVESYDRYCSEPNLNKVMTNDTKTQTILERRHWSLEQGKHKSSLYLNETIHSQGRTSEKCMDDGVNFNLMGFPAEVQNFLLVSKQFPKGSSTGSSQFTESRMSIDGRLAEAIENRFSSFFSPQETGELVNPVIPLPSKGKGSITQETTGKPSILIEAPKGPDTESTKQATVKGRHPSPTSRFSFGLGRMSRSSNFKDSSTVPELSSRYTAVKPGPVMKMTTPADSFDKDKTKSSSKGRSSPLRRLLDPLLKKKESQSSEAVRPLNGTIATREPCHDRKSMGLSSQGLLQLSLKNGLPFFKLVVDSSSNDMLAAVVKKLPSSGKSDQSMVYTFYSIRGIKKKSTTWIQGSKNKNCSLGYNIVGLMKISSVRLPKLHSKSSNRCAVRECVLYGVDREQMDTQEPEYLPGKEMAAVVLQTSHKMINDRELSDGKKLYQDENSSSAVIILPGGVHGIPNKGAPSSLINRWRSGGACDCGGWDVGCKLQVLTNHSAKDGVSLFVQGREQNSKPAFNLDAFGSGFYSLELDSSISLLEAFASCVAMVTCKKFSEILDTNIPAHTLEAITGTDKAKAATTTASRRQFPAKYVAQIPPSPVGRI